MKVASLKNIPPTPEYSREEEEDKVIYLWMYNYAICPECGGYIWKTDKEIYLWMYNYAICPECGGYIWKTDKEIYNQRRGVASCANCGHQAWFTFFINEKSIGWVIPKEDVFLFLSKKKLP